MRKKLYYILMTVAMVLGGCADEHEEPQSREVAFCVRAAWQDGLNNGTGHHAPGLMPTTRALSTTDILAEGKGEIQIDFADYPSTISVHCSDGNELTLTKGAAQCGIHSNYWNYTPSAVYIDRDIVSQNLTFTASAVIDDNDDDDDNHNDNDVLTGTATASNISGRHLLFKLHHTKALLRFAFRLNARYDKVRSIVVTDIVLNDKQCPIVNKVLNADALGKLIAYAYIEVVGDHPITTSTLNNIQCTYNIYDKDATFTPDAKGIVTNENLTENAPHLTRQGVVARNTFILGSLKDASSNPISAIQAGYYYDLNVTLNPDYLYVLSDHDNEHLTIR